MASPRFDIAALTPLSSRRRCLLPPADAIADDFATTLISPLLMPRYYARRFFAAAFAMPPYDTLVCTLTLRRALLPYDAITPALLALIYIRHATALFISLSTLFRR